MAPDCMIHTLTSELAGTDDGAPVALPRRELAAVPIEGTGTTFTPFQRAFPPRVGFMAAAPAQRPAPRSPEARRANAPPGIAAERVFEYASPPMPEGVSPWPGAGSSPAARREWALDMVDAMGIGRTAALIYIELCSLPSAATHACAWPSQERLARITRCATSSVRTGLRELEAAGLIITEREPAWAARRNVYRLCHAMAAESGGKEPAPPIAPKSGDTYRREPAPILEGRKDPPSNVGDRYGGAAPMPRFHEQLAALTVEAIAPFDGMGGHAASDKAIARHDALDAAKRAWRHAEQRGEPGGKLAGIAAQAAVEAYLSTLRWARNRASPPSSSPPSSDGGEPTPDCSVSESLHADPNQPRETMESAPRTIA